MATVTKPSRSMVGKEPEKQPQQADQLRRERMIGIVTLIIVVLLMALVIWLASLGGGVQVDHFDYYPMP